MHPEAFVYLNICKLMSPPQGPSSALRAREVWSVLSCLLLTRALSSNNRLVEPQALQNKRPGHTGIRIIPSPGEYLTRIASPCSAKSCLRKNGNRSSSGTCKQEPHLLPLQVAAHLARAETIEP